MGTDTRELTSRVLVHAELGEQSYEAGTPRARATVSRAHDAHEGRELGQPSLLAPDGEHLDAVDGRAVPAGEHRLRVKRARRPRLRLVEVSPAEGQRRRDLLGGGDEEGPLR